MGTFGVHSSYARTAIDGVGSRHKVSVARVKCGNRACGVTHACLYDFLIPYKQHTVEAISPYVGHYLKELSTYLDTAWQWEFELMPDQSLVFRWLSTLLRHVSLLVQQRKRCSNHTLEVSTRARED